MSPSEKKKKKKKRTRSAPAVPDVATIPYPSSASDRATGTTSALYLSVMEMKMVPEEGRADPAAIAAFAYAAPNSASMPMTSPVDFISGPSSVSAPANLSNGRTASLTATWVRTGSSVKPTSARVSPAIRRAACAARGAPTAFATKGTVRDARGLASMMKTSPSWTAYWMLSRPTTPRARAMAGVHSRMVARAASGMVWVGMEQAESPEWTPACSMCCRMPAIATAPSLSHSASTSISSARSRYLSMRTGLVGSTAAAAATKRDRSFWE